MFTGIGKQAGRKALWLCCVTIVYVHDCGKRCVISAQGNGLVIHDFFRVVSCSGRSVMKSNFLGGVMHCLSSF